MLNISRTGGGFRWGIAIIAILVASACASSGNSSNPITPDSAVPAAEPARSGEVFGPFPNAGIAPAPEPADLVANPDRVVLVFGRGLTHGYAYVGALRALQEMKITVHAIYATEVGALAAALFLTQPNSNRVDWALLRFTEKNLGPAGTKFSFRLNSPERELDGKLREVFGDRRVEAVADRLHVGLQDVKTGESIFARSGDLWRAIRATLAGTNGYPPIDFEGRTAKTSARGLAEDFRSARASEKYPIVVISAGEAPTDGLRRLVSENHGIVVTVPLNGIDDLDLKRKNQAVFSGKSAVQRASADILGLVGRKPE